MPKISNDLLQTYFLSANRHPIYQETVTLYDSLRIHADGEFPSKMISERRPSETDEILEYRQKTYKAITKLPVSKVITSLSKIRRSPDWSISFDDDAISKKIIEQETLENYINKNMPGYGNITDWAFGILLKQNAIDANAVVAVIPLSPVVDNEYTKPVPIIFNSDHVLEYSEEKQIAILKSRKKVNYLLDNGAINFNQGDRYYYIDDFEVVIYDQNKDGFSPVFQQKHNLGKMPVFKVKGEAFRQYDNMVVNRSRLDAMIPFLDEAACEYSDLKGSKIQHLFPLFWYYQNKSCNTCNGIGTTPTENGAISCKSCSGSGKVKFSPFSHIQVDPAQLGQQANPMPPAGYITRDTAILDMQDKSVDKNNYKALAAINMQFLDQTPLNISGEAKSVDREELNNFVYNVAEDLIATIDKAIYFINEWRYSYIIPDAEARKAMLPNIPVPQNFDLLPSDYLMQELTQARANKANPFLLAKLEEDIAVKKFYGNPELADVIRLYFELDPLPGLTVDEKMSLISNKAITQEDFIISSYMAQFIKRALIDDDKFCEASYDNQMKILKKYAAEKIAANDTAQQMIDAQKQQVISEMQQQSAQQQQAKPNNQAT
jgi:hypothetical protein